MNTTSKVINGVNVEQLMGTIEAIKGNADIAQFKFKSHTKWIDGGKCQTEIKDFYGALQNDDTRLKPFILEGDEPPVLLGENKAPNAVEVVLHGLASCLSVGIVYNAAAMGIEVKDLSFTLEGDIDLHGFLGLSEEVRPGYKNIKVKIHANTNVPQEKVVELLDYVKKTSPVLDIISNPVPVSIELV